MPQPTISIIVQRACNSAFMILFGCRFTPLNDFMEAESNESELGRRIEQYKY